MQAMTTKVAKRRSKMGRPSLSETDPELVAIVGDMITKGCAHYEIADQLKIKMQQVYQIERSLGDKLPPADQRLRQKWQRAANSATEVLIQKVENGELKGGQIAFAAGIATDKFQGLSGAPTAIVEHVSKPDPEALRKAIEEAARNIRKAESVEVDATDQSVGDFGKVGEFSPHFKVIPADSSLNKSRSRAAQGIKQDV